MLVNFRRVSGREICELPGGKMTISPQIRQPNGSTWFLNEAGNGKGNGKGKRPKTKAPTLHLMDEFVRGTLYLLLSPC